MNGSIQDLLVRPLIEFDECPDYGSRGTDEWNSLLALDWRQFHTLNCHPIHKRTYCNFSVYIREDSRKENILDGDLVTAVSLVLDPPLHNQ